MAIFLHRQVWLCPWQFLLSGLLILAVFTPLLINILFNLQLELLDDLRQLLNCLDEALVFTLQLANLSQEGLPLLLKLLHSKFYLFELLF